MPERAQEEMTPLRTALSSVLKKRERWECNYQGHPTKTIVENTADLLDALLAAIPTLSRDAVERVLHAHFNYGNIKATCGREEPCPQLFEDFGALALPPRPMVTKLCQAIDYYLTAYQLGCEVNNVKDCGECAVCRIQKALSLCTGAGEEPKAWCEHWLPEIWCGRPAFARGTGMETDIIYRESPVRFCDRCGTPRPEGR